MRSLLRVLFSSLALAALSGCNCTGEAVVSHGGDAGRGTPDGSTPSDAGDADGGAAADAGFCQGSGPVITVGTGTATHDECTGQLAEITFLNALCTCHDTNVAGYLLTTGFNSQLGPYDPADAGGGTVGVNNAFAVGVGDTDVGGSLSVAGSQSLNLAGYLRARGDLRLAGTSTVAGVTVVGRDGWLGGNFTDVGTLSVGRDLHYAGVLLTVANVTGTKTQGPVTIPPPCPCSPADIIDVAALVAGARTQNDDAAMGLQVTRFQNVTGSTEVTLPCGRYYVEGISGAGQILVHVDGRVAMFVKGSVGVLGSLKFDLGAKGELDLFIEKDLLLIGTATFGDKNRPAATRIYVGGAGDVSLVGSSGFVGNIYAPHSKVTAVGYAEVYGSVVAGDFTSPGYARFIYDRAIAVAGKDCPLVNLPPGACRQCGVCTGGTACVSGTCGACTVDSDCCGQSVCTLGKCEDIIN
jgi:hypothetical protein